MLGVLCLATQGWGQQPDDPVLRVHHDDAPDEGLGSSESALTAGFEKTSGNGFFLRTEDDLFELRIGLYTQIRYNANWRNAPADEYDFERGFSVNRTRLFFTGHYTERYGYHFRINWNDSFDPELLVAFAQYNGTEDSHLRVGKQFMALSREDWMFAHDLLTTEFSPNDFTFAIGPSTGLQHHKAHEKRRYWLGVGNGAFGGRREFPAPDAADIALTSRYEHALSGEDWSVWDDLVGGPGRARGTLLGGGAAYQYTGKDSPDPDNAAQLNLDISFNGDGYQAMLSGSATWLDPDSGSHYTYYGALAQAGYFISAKDQLYAQYNFLSSGGPTAATDFNSIALGLNHFPFAWTNRWKLSFEGGYLFDALNDTIVEESGSLGWLSSDHRGQAYLRLQAQFGF
jgi:Phosphate-selective porin O and P